MSSMSNNGTAAASVAERLWRQRFTSFAREALAYWRDVARSGFLLVLVAALIGGAYEYGIALRRLPGDFPYLWVIAAVMIPALALGSVRTLVKPADRVFLLPLEGRLTGYFLRAYLYSFALQGAKTAAALMLIWPLYAHFGGGQASAATDAVTQPFGLMLATALAYKAGHLWADWQESHLDSARRQTIFIFGRIVVTAVVVPFWFGRSYGRAWILTAIAVMLWVFLLFNSRKYVVGWNRLLQREATQQRRLYRWFRWFTDVPQLPAPVRRRRWTTFLSRRLSIRQEHTFMYLYEKTLLRTDLFGMYGRLSIVGAAIVWFVSEAWLKSVFLVAVPLLGLMQLSALADAHRYSFWLELFPVQRRRQSSAVLALIAPFAAAQATLLSASYALSAPAGLASAIAPLLSLGAVLLALRFRLQPSLRSRFEPGD